jgi:predicted anti-sigma-YlaC factor YlaD
MTCEAFETRLDALLDGRCSADQWRETEAHLAGCTRCRRVFDAMSGRADDMDAEGHESLSQAVVAKTSGGGCSTARQRLCDFVDGALAPFDRNLVDGHLARCSSCAALAAALAETTALLPSFAGLSPRVGVVREVLTATSRRPVRPTFGGRVSAWWARAAQRPRFSLEVAYVLTVLLVIVLGNPVDAFKEAAVRAQPRVGVAVEAMSRPLAHVRAVGEKTWTNVERAIKPKAEPVGSFAEDRALLWQWWQTHVDAPVRSIMSQLSDWMGQVVDAIRRAMGASATEPAPPAVR